MPVVLYFIEKYFNTASLRWLLISGFAMAAQVYADSHVQRVLYSDIAATLYFLLRALYGNIGYKKLIKDVALWFILFLGLIAFYLAPLLQVYFEYADHISSAIDRGMLKVFSIHFPKLIILFFPDFFGSGTFGGAGASSQNDYDIFLGTIPLIFIIYATFYLKRDKFVQISFIIALFALINSMIAHLPFLREILYHIPIMNSFRCPARFLFVFIFFLLVISAIGLSKVKENEHTVKLSAFTSKFTIIIFCCLLFFSAFQLKYPNFALSKGGSKILFTAIALFLLLFFHKKLKYFFYPSLCLITLIFTIYQTHPYAKMLKRSSIAEKNLLYEQLEMLANRFDNNKLLLFGDDNIVYDKNFLFSAERYVPNHIFSLNAYSSYSNPRLYKLLNFTPNNTRLNWTEMLKIFPNYALIYRDDILAMLGVKHIHAFDSPIKNLDTITLSWQNIDIPIVAEREILAFSDIITVESNGLYEIEVEFENVNIANNTDNYIYFDLYNSKMDGGNFRVNLLPNKLNYKVYLYSGDLSRAKDEPIYFRVVSKTNAPMNIRKLEFETASLPAFVKKIDFTMLIDNLAISESLLPKDYHLYINDNARNILHKPDNVFSIEDEADIYANIENYNFYNSYIQNFKNIDLTSVHTEIRDINFKTNSISATVTSDAPTFINFSQNYFNGWKAKVNGKKTPIYLVNGAIMGIEAPAGISSIKIYYQPAPVYIALIISFLTIVILIIYLFKQFKLFQSKKV
ncbi:MAG: YfhO family protein [Deferribacteraceae bacterium]|nr:YfhO family protein [Deferribacteraceae bacterium]